MRLGTLTKPRQKGRRKMESDAEVLLNQATVLRTVEMWQVEASVACRLARVERAERERKEKGDSNASDIKIYS